MFHLFKTFSTKITKEERIAKINATKEIRVAEAPYKTEITKARTKPLVIFALVLLVATKIIEPALFLALIGATGIGDFFRHKTN